MADRKNSSQSVPKRNRPTPAQRGIAEEYLLVEEEWVDDEPERHARNFGWSCHAGRALSARLDGFFRLVHQQTILAGASPAQWSAWIVDWAVPVLLVVALWLLAMRNSRREAARFGVAAQSLAQESALLERRLVTVNRELSLARDFIAAQSRDLESLGGSPASGFRSMPTGCRA
jgi:hypothetical protein